ncbi:MAG: hypothetical protein H7A32_02920 [Deltaproteobacteria bacterium]|nr:hypothetical protein [Deltaproteobacteria bacterium]
MSLKTKSAIAIVVALPHESKAVLSQMKVSAKTKYHQIKLYEGTIKQTPCHLVITGMGLERAYEGTRFFLETQKPQYLINMGYAGGLDPEIKNPEMILADKISLYDEEKKNKSCHEHEIQLKLPLLEKIRKILQKENEKFHQGKLLSARHPILQSNKKLELHESLEAIAIDMESYSVIQAANEKNIPAISMRFIVDAQKEELSDTSSFIDDTGKVKPLSLITTSAKNPKILLELPSLAMLAQKARQHMEETLMMILEHL